MLTAKITTAVVAEQTGSGALATPEVDLSKSYVQNYANGTAVDQAQVLFSDSRTAAGSSSDNLDLAGTLAAPLGGTVTFAALKELIIKNKSSANQIRVGKKVTNGFAGPFDQTAGSLGILVEPNGILHLRNPGAAGWTVTSGTGDQLSVENLGATATDYDVILIGK